MSMDPTSNKRRALGRGLDSLLPPAPASKVVTGPEQHPTAEPQGVRPAQPNVRMASVFVLPVEDLQPNPEQPRKHFDAESLEELSASIQQFGLLEPIVARPIPGTQHQSQKRYEIVAGERRWRACQKAGLLEVPVLVKEFSDEQALEAGLIENLQREDLNPVEYARAYETLMRQYGYTQEKLAERVGKSRVSVANALRLLKLPTYVLDRLQSGELSEGHGRALLGATDSATAERLAKQALSSGWSVREVEQRVRKLSAGAKVKLPNAGASANTRDLEDRLARALGSRVRVVDRKGKGHLEVSFASYDELDRLIAKFTSTSS